jgi:hypothetical protein
MKKTLISIMLLITIACSSKKITSTPEKPNLIIQTEPKIEVVEPKIEVVELNPVVNEGKFLFENNCANCHDLPNTKQYSAQDWLPIISRMQIQAHLSDVDSDKVYNYIITN